jgi:asparagine synthase (glutamine-hydrolysing)
VKQAALRHIPKIRERYEDYKQLTKPFFHKDFYGNYANKSLPNTYHFNSLQEALYHSTFSRGLQELLRYADRNSMAHSREVRLPFLSHELVDFLFTLPSSFKIHQGWTKWIMRHSFNQIMPPEITWRKDKIGYEPPQKSWMDHPHIHENIVTARESMVKMGILSPKVLNRKIESEESNISRGNNWRLLMCGHLLES